MEEVGTKSHAELIFNLLITESWQLKIGRLISFIHAWSAEVWTTLKRLKLTYCISFREERLNPVDLEEVNLANSRCTGDSTSVPRDPWERGSVLSPTADTRNRGYHGCLLNRKAKGLKKSRNLIAVEVLHLQACRQLSKHPGIFF